MINPWGSEQYYDREKLKKEFGIEDFLGNIPDFYLFKRKLIFGHRAFDYINFSLEQKRPFNVMTGLMPSGEMHLGNKVTIDQVINYQNMGGNVTIAVADLESYATRGISLDEARETAINGYILNYISMGLKPCRIYFQSENKDVQFLSLIFGNSVNFSEMKAIYGFDPSYSMLHINAPIIQAADVLHTQLEKYGGAAPTVVPVGLDQDPHIRLMRDIAKRFRIYNAVGEKDGISIYIKGTEDPRFHIDQAIERLEELGFTKISKNYEYRAIYVKDAVGNDLVSIDLNLAEVESKSNKYCFISPSATFHKLETGLKGGKMSSSVKDSLISLDDSSDEVSRKVKGSVTGGRTTIAEQKKLGGEPYKCPVYELYAFHVATDDEYNQRVYDECADGVRMCGECKAEAAEKINELLLSIKERKDEALQRLGDYLHE